MTKALLLLCAVLALACDPAPVIKPTNITDQCLRSELFEKCMTLVPNGPTHVVANDWAEVIEECRDSSYYMSLRIPGQVKPECRAE